MDLQRVTDLKAADGHHLPALLTEPKSPQGAAVLIPPYGATKEHMLGLALALGEQQVASLSFDPCGHGENQTAIGVVIRDEVEAAIAHLRRYGRVGAIGVSIGGRLALMSSADHMVAISPSIVQEVSPQGKWMFQNFPSPTVREPYSGYVIELLEKLGPLTPHDRPCLLMYAQRDIPAIMEGAAGLRASLPGAELYYVKNDLRPDVQHDNGLIRYLPRWFNHMELKFNYEVMEVTARWMVTHHAVARI